MKLINECLAIFYDSTWTDILKKSRVNNSLVFLLRIETMQRSATEHYYYNIARIVLYGCIYTTVYLMIFRISLFLVQYKS